MTPAGPTLDFNGSPTLTLVITGSYPSFTNVSNAKVTVGATACQVTIAGPSSITCVLGNEVVAGSSTVNVNIFPNGLATGAISVNVKVGWL